MPTSANTLNKLIKSGTPPIIVDVRSTVEFQYGHILGAVHIPFYQSPFQTKISASNKTHRIVIYCEHGPRAYIAWIIFKLIGYKNTTCLRGHMHGWRNSRLPVT